MRTNKFSHSGDILLRIFQHVGRGIVGSRHLHTAKLVELKILLIFSHSLLCKKYGTGIIDVNSKRQTQKYRR